MSLVLGYVDSSTFTNIGAAIRDKNGSTTQYKPSEMPAAIRAIQTGVDTSDATATESDIVKDKTAYVNGEKVTGTLELANYYANVAAPTSEVGEVGEFYIQLV